MNIIRVMPKTQILSVPDLPKREEFLEQLRVELLVTACNSAVQQHAQTVSMTVSSLQSKVISSVDFQYFKTRSFPMEESGSISILWWPATSSSWHLHMKSVCVILASHFRQSLLTGQ
jgi:hypothetical protein